MDLGVGFLHQWQPSLTLVAARAEIKRTLVATIIGYIEQLIVDHSRDPVSVFEEDEAVDSNFLIALNTESL